ncbi:cortex morphogenetic protein CmpA [Bacillus testis]|nr:cortex morphogenetic protein CmpA [Bacillus testis]
MPVWLEKQIRKAFLERNAQQVQVLNQCWYFYRKTNNRI